MDYIVPKPISIEGYATHRLVAALTEGAPALHVDEGDQVRIRTDACLPTEQIIGFSLRACVSYKNKGRHRYYPTSDWRARHAWLEHKGTQHGFEIITAHASAKHFAIEKPGHSFNIDDTQFTGVLKVVDAAKFAAALLSGVGNTARAFGFGMLVI
jgi:CRISPR-associated protein Cas6/Cse3/CasE subtype I-E